LVQRRFLKASAASLAACASRRFGGPAVSPRAALALVEQRRETPRALVGTQGPGYFG